jgi:2-dehydropantoate 2-reductase
MHVAIVGAGALGRIAGVRLHAAGSRVSFVVRPGRETENGAIAIEQVNGAKRADSIASPVRVTAVPPDCRVVVLAVRFDQLALGDLLTAAPRVPVVVLTPLLPDRLAALEGTLGARVVAAMPGFVGYVDERGVTRYWITSVAATLLDDVPVRGIPDGAGRATLEDLARELVKGGLPTRLERDVAGMNAATTIAFYPLIAVIDAGGGIDGVLANRGLIGLALDAAKECEALAKKLGRVAPWAGMLTKFVGPFTIKPGIALGKRLAPEAVTFVERHFGPKLHDQHLAMGEAILALGRERGVAMPSLAKLCAALGAKS